MRRTLPLLLVLPVAVGAVTASLLLSGPGQGQGIREAPGRSGSDLHPLAGSFVVDSTSLADCGKDSTCLRQAFGNVAFRAGPRAALALFHDRLEADEAVQRNCHQIAHLIGAAALARNGGDVARTFSQGDPVCVSGYYHGILERAFLGISSPSQLVAVARTICDSGGLRRRGFLDYQCRHGLGHGLMIQTGYDLPRALSICAQLGTGWDRAACSSGTFMENANTSLGFRSPWLDDERPVEPCPRMLERDRHSCYLRASWRILTAAGGDFAKAGQACADLGRWAQTCFRGLGRDAVEEGGLDAARVLDRCTRTESGRPDCLLGAARTVANASGAAGIAPAAALCRSAARTDRDACFSGVGIVVGMLEPTDAARAERCRRITPAHRHACTTAAVAEVEPSGARSWG
jgi:hypothetical protein